MLDDWESYMHTHNSPHKKIPETVSLHINNQGSVSNIYHLLGDKLGRKIYIFVLTVRSANIMLIFEMLARIMGSTIDRYYFTAKSTLSALLGILLYKKT
jgi:hypothetical protein